MNSTLLLVHNLGYSFSVVTTAFIGFLVLFKGAKVLVNRTFFLTNIFYSIFGIFYLLGTNTSDPHLSKFYIMFTLVNLFTVTGNAHTAWEFLGLGKKFKKMIVAFYSIAVLLCTFFLLVPNSYILDSRPYLYLPNFYNAGNFYWMFTTFFLVVAVIFIGTLIKSWLAAVGNERTRISYFLIAFVIAYGTGSIAFLPIFGINADPLYAGFIGVHSVIIAYAILNYKILDLHVVAAKAINFSLFTVLSGFLIVAINWINNYSSQSSLGLPNWVTPLLSGLGVLIIGYILLKKLREADVLKYEFINNISHKFRTPLTHIRWMSEELRTEADQITRDREVEQIQYATMRLFELTNIVIDAAKDTEVESIYHTTSFDIKELIKNMIDAHADQITRKHLTIEVNYSENILEIKADKTRLQFAMQILFENAIVYTPDNGKVIVNASYNKSTPSFTFYIKDSGIGIANEDLPKLFRKFFRTSNARLADTEGMGICLYMAKKIILRHNGNIQVNSDGLNTGTAFSFTIPQEA
ncbi:MAG: ATP-binding protein [bacterium]